MASGPTFRLSLLFATRHNISEAPSALADVSAMAVTPLSTRQEKCATRPETRAQSPETQAFPPLDAAA